MARRPTVSLVVLPPETVRALLRRGALRLAAPEVWHQHVQATTALGEPVLPEAGAACSWCCLGALRREALAMCGTVHFEGPARRLYDAATRLLAEALVQQLDCRRVSRDAATALAAWNDAAERTHEQVLNLFALAA